jgi:thioredoxin reductase (NADPH)
MADRKPLVASSPPEHILPRLTPAQIARVQAHGSVRNVEAGEVLLEAGTPATRMFVVMSGQLEVVRLGDAEQLVAEFRPGQFTGEMNMLSGRPSVGRIRATEAGEAIELQRDEMLALVQTDAELSEILMRAFILRRVDLVAQGVGDVVLIGPAHSSGTLRAKEFLTRNGHPHAYFDLDRDSDVQKLLDRFRVAESDVPVLICRGQVVLRNPSNRQIAECLGFNDAVDETVLRDVVIVGADPSGLAAAVYAASEGLNVLVLEANAPGGQAGSSVRWRERPTDRLEIRAIRHVFVMTGATPCTGWLDGCVALDSSGFIKTGPDLSKEDLADAGWPLARLPHLLETSLPGVFAVGDVRARNLKRVASAVGEGSTAVAFVHQAMADGGREG